MTKILAKLKEVWIHTSTEFTKNWGCNFSKPGS